MSTVETTLNTNSQQTTNYDVAKIFVWNNRYEKRNCTGDAYEDYEVGTVMAIVASTNELVPLAPGASDGSQYPVGVLAQVVETGSDGVATICVSGDVVESKLVFFNTATLATVISGKTLRDRIGSDTVGINLTGGDEQTAFDNQ